MQTEQFRDRDEIFGRNPMVKDKKRRCVLIVKTSKEKA